MTRIGHVLKGAGAAVLLAVVVAGVPWALWHFIGWPLPHHLPTPHQVGHALGQAGISDRALIDALAVVVWCTWAMLMVSIAAEIPAALAGRHATRLPLAGLFQPVSGRLVTAVAVALLALGPRSAHATAPASVGGLSTAPTRDLVAAVTIKDADSPATLGTEKGHDLTSQSDPALSDSALSGALRPLRVAAPSPVSGIPPAVPIAAGTTAATSRTYVVQPGDTLWAIAEAQLGDPLRWSDIYALNEGRLQPDGRTLSDPHWIYPDWTLILPPGPSLSVAAQPPTSIPDQVPTVPADPAPPPQRASDPPAVSTPATPTPAPTAHQLERPTLSRPDGDPHAPRGDEPVQLASGSVVAGSFAAGVLSALAAGRVRRRRHYRPQAPGPGGQVDSDIEAGGLRDLLVAVQANGHVDDAELTPGVSSEPAPMTATPDDDALAHPDVIDAASRGDEVVHLGLCDWPGMTLSGRGATSALRAWLAALLARNGPYGTEILAVEPLGDRLFPGLAVPGLRRVGSLADALYRLESASADRRSQLAEGNASDAASHRGLFPEDPLPFLLVVTDLVPDSLVSRWGAMVECASTLGIGALVCLPEHVSEAPCDGGLRLVIGEHGSLEQVTPPPLADLLQGSRLFQVGAVEGVDLLGPIASVHNGDAFEQRSEQQGVSAENFDGRAADVSSNGVGSRAEGEEAEVAGWPDLEDRAGEAPIWVELFGPARVEARGETIDGGLRASAYELLAWYAMHPDGAAAEVAIEALWPDASAKRGRERFWTALGNLRSRLQGPGEQRLEILTKSGKHYRPDPSALDLDLWRFEAALTEATQATEPADVLHALEAASAAYGGDFYPGADSLWVIAVREDLHRRAMDVQIRMSELCLDIDRADAAIAALERAIELDPICEEAYRRLIALQDAPRSRRRRSANLAAPPRPPDRARPRARSRDDRTGPT